jgi:hypothetical protein
MIVGRRVVGHSFACGDILEPTEIPNHLWNIIAFCVKSCVAV